MTVYEICEMYINENERMQIYSLGKEDAVFNGTFREASDSDYAWQEISSFGIENGILVVNID